MKKCRRDSKYYAHKQVKCKQQFDTDETKGDIRIISSNLVGSLMYFTSISPCPLTFSVRPLPFQSQDTFPQKSISNLLSWILE